MVKRRQEGKSHRDVHLFLNSHGTNDRFLPKRLLKGTRTIVYEESMGIIGTPRTFSFPEYTLEQMMADIESLMNQDFAKTLMIAKKRGIRAIPGELGTREMIQDLRDKAVHYNRIITKVQTLDDVKAVFNAFADLLRARYNLIVNTIKQAETPLVARYGSSHSGLSRDLAKAGIKSSREKSPNVNSCGEIVTNKLLAGLKPTEADYKRAAIAGFLVVELQKLGKQPNTKPEISFFDNLHTVILRRLPEQKLDEILRSKTPISQTIYTMTGLPLNPSQSTLRRFLKNHSSFYRRQQGIREMKRKDKK